MNPRKLSFNIDYSIRKLSNFSSISHSYISDSDRNVTLIGNECEELSADYYSVKEFRKAATKESSSRMLCFSQENRASSALKLSITENSQNRIADNEVIFKRKVHKSDKGIKNL